MCRATRHGVIRRHELGCAGDASNAYAACGTCQLARPVRHARRNSPQWPSRSSLQVGPGHLAANSIGLTERAHSWRSCSIMAERRACSTTKRAAPSTFFSLRRAGSFSCPTAVARGSVRKPAASFATKSPRRESVAAPPSRGIRWCARLDRIICKINSSRFGGCGRRPSCGLVKSQLPVIPSEGSKL